MLLDFLVEGHERLVPNDAPVLGPNNLLVLGVPPPLNPNAIGQELQTVALPMSVSGMLEETSTVNMSLGEIKAPSE